MEAFGLVMAGISLLIPICGMVITVAVLVFVGVVIYRQFKKGDVKRAAAQSWPSTGGVVLESRIASQHRAGGGSSQYAHVLYQYEVGGQMYHSSVVNAGDRYMSIRTAALNNDRLARYPAGAQVTVYYNPANPGDAALER